MLESSVLFSLRLSFQGHSEFETAVRVILPLARKGIMAGAVLSFARALGEFGATLMLAGNIPGKTNTIRKNSKTSVLILNGISEMKLLCFLDFPERENP